MFAPTLPLAAATREARFLPFCVGCGMRLPELRAHALACPHCGVELVRADGTRASASPLTKWLHAAASAVVPGAGQALNGQLGRGLFVLLTCWLVVPWIWGIADAWRTAQRAALAPLPR
ncbi:MAG: hypothetical protein JNL90_10025 [Planctomycetes bacterium]|nr:hypothetical protein [Planctomycetota bacterium]